MVVMSVTIKAYGYRHDCHVCTCQKQETRRCVQNIDHYYQLHIK